MTVKPIKGFSKLSKDAKTEWLIDNYFEQPDKALSLIKSYWHSDANLQKLHDEFIENTLTNYYMPFGVAPNFLINDKMYCLPMAIEESSVVAAMAKSGSYWLERGGFKAKVISTTKIGHVHFVWRGADFNDLQQYFDRVKPLLIKETNDITRNMTARGGGILDIELINKSDLEPNYYQIKGSFDTRDSMGANFINTVLEKWSEIFEQYIGDAAELSPDDRQIEVIMCILSNYTPECLVRAEVSCPVEALTAGTDMDPQTFVDNFVRAVHVAEIEPYRAVTHNKGIMNGVDALIIATGNDFRAIEASVHAYAARNGQYKSLSHVEVENGQFTFYIELPLSLGTVGGITSLHPMVKLSNELLGKPNAQELMQIVAVAGLAQNFSALRSLTTTGIQKGHMKMHLMNILNQFEATLEEKNAIINTFKDRVPSYSLALEEFCKLRGITVEQYTASNN
ncbi:MAG: hydroxymethylglutaryl-CoA reductase, degradative [Bacteroidetes bacterium]|jgi:hydroxymethylglutaryl-CoA reductase|nr:hydroxymethylglutaryl-CoA reductase, degradative [Bacteroidota bacterium]